MGEPGQKPSNKQPNFLNLLVLVHLKNYFIEALNKFLMCFETNGFKMPPLPPVIYLYYSTAVEIFLLLKHREFTKFLYLCFEMHF